MYWLNTALIPSYSLIIKIPTSRIIYPAKRNNILLGKNSIFAMLFSGNILNISSFIVVTTYTKHVPLAMADTKSFNTF